MWHWIKVISGPLAAAIVWLLQPEPDVPSVNYMVAMVVWMVAWWVFQAVPLGVTALVPVLWYPFTGIMPAGDVASHYMNPIIFLFVGGFLVAFAMEKWNLHRRVALTIITRIGFQPPRILLGFMAASWFLSMWISNTATAIVLLAPVMALLSNLEKTGDKSEFRGFNVAILLGIAYAASIGGSATLVGSPPNLIAAGLYEEHFPGEIQLNFLNWFIMALPLSLIFFILTYSWLRFFYLKDLQFLSSRAEVVKDSLKGPKKLTYEEKVVIVAFVLMAGLWFTRAGIDLGAVSLPGWSALFPHGGFLHDGTVAVLIALILFLIPAKSKENATILGRDELERLPLNVIFLFGGGFALAAGFEESGLSEFLSDYLGALEGVPMVLLILVIGWFVVFLTEVTSNTAVAQFVLPVLIVLSTTLNLPPYWLMVPATLSASYAFMMPVATPPNTIVFSSERLEVTDMAQTGFLMNLLGPIMIVIMMYLYGSFILGG